MNFDERFREFAIQAWGRQIEELPGGADKLIEEISMFVGARLYFGRDGSRIPNKINRIVNEWYQERGFDENTYQPIID